MYVCMYVCVHVCYRVCPLVLQECKASVAQAVEDKLLDALISEAQQGQDRESFRSLLRDGGLEDRIIDIDAPVKGQDKGAGIGVFGIEGGQSQIMEAFRSIGNGSKKKTERKKMPISEARGILEEIESERLLGETSSTYPYPWICTDTMSSPTFSHPNP
jgi:ATP-dependent HslUV protease ATP-binding subunit HslU